MNAGELAALGTATCWTGSSVAFEAATRRIGSLSLNLTRVLFAFGWLALLGLVMRGRPLPTDADAAQWGWLALSGLVGMTLGDLCTFRAYVEIGARRTMVVSTSTPIFAAALGWVALGERIRPSEALGMLVIVLGVGLAVSRRRETAGAAAAGAAGAGAPGAGSAAGPGAAGGVGAGAAGAGALAAEHAAAVVGPGAGIAAAGPGSGRGGNDRGQGHVVRGVLLGLGGALGQAGGLLLSKRGMDGYDVVPATQIRVLAGIAGFIVVLTLARWWPRLVTALRDRTALAYTALGALLGPSIGVAFSLYAVAHAPAGIASSIMSTTPILIIPVALARGEQVGLRGMAGAALAVTGVVILAAA